MTAIEPITSAEATAGGPLCPAVTAPHTTRNGIGKPKAARSRRWRVLQVVVVVIATWHFAMPQLPRLRDALHALGAARPLLVLIGAGCAGLALVAYAQLIRTMLGKGTRPGLWHTLAINTTALGVSNLIPAGSAAGGLVAFRLLERAGVARSRAGVAMAVTSLGSTAVLNVLLGVGLIALIPTRGLASGAIAAIPSLVLMVSVVFVVRAILREDGRLWAAAGALERRLPGLADRQLRAALVGAAVQLRACASRPLLMAHAVFWAAVNWLVDIVALWALLAAVGVKVAFASVLVAFAVANLAAVIPITPGGLGIVELTLTATLVGLGAPAAPTALGVTVYRIFSYWLPIPTAAVTYLATRVITGHHAPAMAVH